MIRSTHPLYYKRLFDSIRIPQEKEEEVFGILRRFEDDRERYQALPHPAPWEVVAAIHNMEASGDFDRVQHNGQKIVGTGKKTTLVPKGKGPFETWEESAIDAHRFRRWHTPGSIYYWLEMAERFNGLGYRNKGLHSPYLVGGSDLETPGRYMADGRWSPRGRGRQIGVATILKVIQSGWFSRGRTSVFLESRNTHLLTLECMRRGDRKARVGFQKEVAESSRVRLELDGIIGPATVGAWLKAGGFDE
ncbi:MAG: hypothetical protein ACYTEQ_01310 [Planctomycetota bacterium]|jgi:lysozyme family protein